MATKTSPTIMTTSAFVPASPPSQRPCLTNCDTMQAFPMPLNATSPKKDAMESETEDEEVKMNCVGGFRGIEDSDMNTTDDDGSIDGEDDDDDDDDGPDKNQGVVNFVSKRVPLRTALPLIRPKARLSLSPHEEEGDQEDEDSDSSSSSSDSSRSSIGARGIPLSLGTPSALSEASFEELDDGEREGFGSDGDDESVSSSSSSSSEEDENDEAPQAETAKSVDNDAEPPQDSSSNVVEEQNDDDDELSDILQSLGEDRLSSEPDELDSSERYIGVMEDRENLITIPKAKRVLSFNTLAALNIEARGKDDSPKRLKPTEGSFDGPALLPSFSLGAPALTDTLAIRLSMRRESPVISSSDEEEELDRQLGAELRDQERSTEENTRNKTPVPLLTPPGSPLTVHLDGDTTTVCEWPSNLAVDSAMAAVSELRPMSPTSLEDLERKECQQTSALTPLLRGIYVGD